MTNDRQRTGDWDRTEWEGDVPDRDRTLDPSLDPTDAPSGAAPRWQKTEMRGDQGEGPMPPMDPDAMPEGETGLSGDRHAPGEQHWSRGQSRDPS
jgi:hypothetical protein